MVQISRRDAYFYDETGKFLPEKFLRCVEVEASKIPYNKDVPRKGQLPPYYDETKFKKAQLIFENHKVSILFAKLAGLILLLFYITAVRIIILTKKSNTPATAYVRYRDTLQHVVTWYTSDFKDGSRLWKSINTVKAMHHTASSKAAKVPNMSPISQRELAGTVYGFIGFVITKPQYFGLQDLTDDDLEAIVHFWRVICYLLGVDDRYNLCRESLAETKEIFHEASEAYFKRFLLLRLPSYECMQFAAVEGINRITATWNRKFAGNAVFIPKEDTRLLQFSIEVHLLADMILEVSANKKQSIRAKSGNGGGHAIDTFQTIQFLLTRYLNVSVKVLPNN
ncbi:hypothetical protein Trydic_g11825 [Trypoxylus dichotomus]